VKRRAPNRHHKNNQKMPALQISVQRFSVTSSKSFESVMAAIDAAVGHPDMRGFSKDMTVAPDWASLEEVVHKAVGNSGFMEFVRFDPGAVLRKESGQPTPKMVRIVIGNPLVMREMAKHVPDTGSYAPVSVLIDERSDGVHLSYDTMASLLASYGNEKALEVARHLDFKIQKLLTEAAEP
jgi:uncharacterized protein (DUF302 family)